MHPEVVQDHPGDCPICGMDLEPKAADVEQDDDKKMLWKLIAGAVLTIPILVLSPMWQFLFCTLVLFGPGLFILKKGIDSFKNRSLNMFSLIFLGVMAAYIYSAFTLYFPGDQYFETAAVITVLVILGQFLELKARSKTNQALRALLSRGAKSARLVRDGVETEIPIEHVKIGDILRVKPGDKVPVDGVVTEGASSIDESMISGEPMPVFKESGSKVVGGTINQEGSFLMVAEKIGKDTLLARIVQLVEEAGRSRAPIQSLADKVSSYFVPAVALTAVITFVVWALFGHALLGLVNAVAVLIIACPCALGLATPISIMVGVGRGAEEGILIKNAESLETLETIKTFVVDKTGTLTEGKPKVTDVKGDVLQLAASLEKQSEHPLASAIVKAAVMPLLSVKNFRSYTGKGVSGNVEGHDILVGKPSFLKEMGVNGSLPGDMLVARDGALIGSITVSDPIKKTSKEAVRELHKLGKKVIILTGDQEKTATAVAKELGIDEVHAGLSPEDKLEFIKKHPSVAMAGDGINDAPALSLAEIGIAMGNGTDVAMESAPITLVKGDLMGLVKAIHLSQKVMRNIRQNLFFAFIYNTIGIPLAAGLLYPFTGWLLSPIIAALAMSLSSVSVIANALRLRNIKL